MTAAQVHLALNHLPLFGLPIALLFLVYGMRRNQTQVQRLALKILVGLSVSIVPIYLTGEPAEEVVEHLNGTSEMILEQHEEAAPYGLVLVLLTGISAGLALFIQNLNTSRRLQKATLL
jgi:hypothetical protein